MFTGRKKPVNGNNGGQRKRDKSHGHDVSECIFVFRMKIIKKMLFVRDVATPTECNICVVHLRAAGATETVTCHQLRPLQRHFTVTTSQALRVAAQWTVTKVIHFCQMARRHRTIELAYQISPTNVYFRRTQTHASEDCRIVGGLWNIKSIRNNEFQYELLIDWKSLSEHMKSMDTNLWRNFFVNRHFAHFARSFSGDLANKDINA